MSIFLISEKCFCDIRKLEKINMEKERNLDNEYAQCGHVDCAFYDCPLSKGPCLFCVENDDCYEED